MDLSFLLQFVNTSKVAGWTRAAVGALLTAEIAQWPWLAQYLTPTTQTAIAVAASGIAVGVWSHLAKHLANPTPATPAGLAQARK